MRKFFKGATFYILIFLMILVLVRFYSTEQQPSEKFNITRVYQELKSNNVGEFSITEKTIEGTLKDGTKFESYIPPAMEEPFGSYISLLSRDAKLDVEGVAPVGRPWFMDILPSVFMILIFVVFWFVFMQNSQGGGSKVMSFGKSRAKLHKEDDGNQITFAEVAGLKEEKEEMEEIVDFLKAPKKYIDLGARIPKGILLVGPPGTGKTYLAKAVAGEAGVPFFSISGSDFVEMFVGVGASRVRDLFENAKKNAPCVVFIDEIDAVGRKRGAGLGGGHDEREQTLNQLLVEMDGFSDNEGIIMVAATNRPDILDPALLRPGRFDREITVGYPDVREREEIIKVHARNKPMSDDVDYKILAKSTPGFTPADIENILNESALLTARKDEKKIRMETIEDATTKVITGIEKKSKIVTEKERNLTAYHEAGHAILMHVLEEHAPVNQVTIIPRGKGAGGFTMPLPDEQIMYKTKKQMEADIMVSLGGRIAEKLILNDISTGASSDLKSVTATARAMVTKYAMSENLSSMSYDTGGEVFLGRDMTSSKDYSEQVAAEIDREVRRIVDDAYDKSTELLEKHIDQLHAIAKALLEFETIKREEIDLVFDDGLEALQKLRASEESEASSKGGLDLSKKEDEPTEEEKVTSFEKVISDKTEIEGEKTTEEEETLVEEKETPKEEA